MSSRLAAVLLALALLVAVAVNVAKAALSPATVRYWSAIAACETGGNWRMHGSVYSGGLGFANSTWSWWARELGLADRYPSADRAPRLVQMRVADWGRRVHHGYWGCA